MQIDLDFKIPSIEPVHCELFERHRVVFNVLRLDQIHPTIHGNKWFKLKHNVAEIQRRGIKRVLSFGGAYSNQLYALAAAGREFGFETIGVIRGELVEPLNPVLRFALENGMQLHAISRSEYSHKQEPDFLAELKSRFGDFYLLPQGGSNALAVEGCMEIADYIRWQTDFPNRFIALPCGTGSTLAGILCGLQGKAESSPVTVYGIAVLKAKAYLQQQVQGWLQDRGVKCEFPWQISEQYHCGGYAKSSPGLVSFLQQFREWSNIPL